MNFKEELKKRANEIEQELKKHVRNEDAPEKKLNEAVEYSLMAGGKRLRPILMLEVYRLFANDVEVVMPFAIAMEMLHNFSLIHDDLPGIDNDDFRHGKPTNHKQFGEATAILAGDSLFNQAYLVIAKSMQQDINTNKTKAFYEFVSAADKMIIGEYVDTEFEGKPISQDYLEYIHKNKTAALLKGSLRIGAILANAPEEDLEILTKYAEKIGLAFQIRDDILSEIGDEKVLGKPVGNDKERNKCTYVTKYGLEEAKKMLHDITCEAVEIARQYKEKGKFLEELAIFIEKRDK